MNNNKNDIDIFIKRYQDAIQVLSNYDNGDNNVISRRYEIMSSINMDRVQFKLDKLTDNILPSSPKFYEDIAVDINRKLSNFKPGVFKNKSGSIEGIYYKSSMINNEYCFLYSLLSSITRGHYFYDGNKRTALIVTLYTANDYDISISENSAVVLSELLILFLERKINEHSFKDFVIQVLIKDKKNKA